MKKLVVVSVACFSLFFFSASAFAVGPADCFILKGGIYSPQSDGLENFDNSYSFEIAVRHNFSPMFGIEVGIGYIDLDTDIWALPVTGTLKAFIPIGKAIEFFGGAGAGMYKVSAYCDDALGWHVVAGLDFNISETVFLGVEARYIWVEGDFENGVDMDLDGFTAMAALGFRF